MDIFLDIMFAVLKFGQIFELKIGENLYIWNISIYINTGLILL